MIAKLWRLLTTPTALKIVVAVLGVIIKALSGRLKATRS